MVDTFDYILKKYNVEVGRQYVIELPIVGGEGLAHLFSDLEFKEGVEIGTDQGEYAEVLLKANPSLQLTCVDPWRAVAYQPGEQPESNEDQLFFDKRYKETTERLKPFDSRCHIVRETSMDVVSIVGDNSLDFVYIDGNHDFLNVTQDIHFWTRKVRKGGIVAGHDYVRYPSRKFNHVQKVVNAYTQAYHLLPIFTVIPTDRGMKRDRFRSWFFVKK